MPIITLRRSISTVISLKICNFCLILSLLKILIKYNQFLLMNKHVIERQPWSTDMKIHYIQDYEKFEGIQLNQNNIFVNEGLRSISKFLLIQCGVVIVYKQIK